MSLVAENTYLKLEDVLKNIKDVDKNKVNELYLKAINSYNKKIVVLDDDPTGVQTVHDISVVTDWEKETLVDAFKEDCNMFFILTNSRSFTKEETINVHEEIAKNIMYATKETNKEFVKVILLLISMFFQYYFHQLLYLYLINHLTLNFLYL